MLTAIECISPGEAKPPFFAGIDLGGTNIKVGLVDDLGRPVAKISIPTLVKKGPDDGARRMGETVLKVIQQVGLKSADVAYAGLGSPGTMDIPAGMLIDPPNLPGWTNFPIRDLVAEKMKLPTVLQNDANAAAYGEFWAGAAQKAKSLVFWTLGTGIGCGIIIDDLIIEGAHSHGAECGHIIVEMTNGRLCGTGQYGTLEAYAGANALIARCEEALAAGRISNISARIAAGDKVTPLLIAQLAE